MAKSITTLFTSLLVLLGGISILLPLLFASEHFGYVDMIWYALSFFIGLSMIILPSALPVALLTVPLALEKGFLRGVGAVLSFGLGVVVTLSIYGVLISWAGKAGLSFLHLRTEDVLYWVYFFSGIFVYIVALSEIGLLRTKMSSYMGRTSKKNGRSNPELELFFLGIFLGNIGVGGMHSGVPLLFLDASASGNVFYGWSLFFVNAIGRILPLLLLVVLSVRGVPALSWLILRKEEIRRMSGWVMLFIAVFLTTLGFFGSNWLLGNLEYNNTEVTPLSYVLLGNAFLSLLLLFPLWFSYFKARKDVLSDSTVRMEKIQDKIDDLHDEHSSIAVVSGLPDHVAVKHLGHIEHEVLGLEKEKRVIKSMVRHGVENVSHDSITQFSAKRELRAERNRGLLLSLFLICALLLIPYEFLGGANKAHRNAIDFSSLYDTAHE